jgi:hypothetical protein
MTVEGVMKVACGPTKISRLFSLVFSITTLTVIALLASAVYAQDPPPPQLVPYIHTIVAGTTSGTACPLQTFSGSVPMHGTCPGDGGSPTISPVSLDSPYAVAVDSVGNLYIGTLDGIVRRVDAVTGNISTYAGGFNKATSPASTCLWTSTTIGDGCPANEAYLNSVRGLAIAPVSITTCVGTDGHGAGCPSQAVPILAGDLVISDNSASRIRVIDHTTYLMNTVVKGSSTGTGTIGSNGTAMVHQPDGIAFNAFSQLAIADNANARIDLVDFSTGQETVVLGTGTGSCGTPTTGSATTISGPSDVSFDAAGNLYVAVMGCGTVLQLAADSTGHVSGNSTVTIIAGTNGTTTGNAVNGPATSLKATLRAVKALPNGDLFIGDNYNSSNTYGHLYYYDHNTKYVKIIAGGATTLGCTIGGVAVAAPYNGCPGTNIRFTSGPVSSMTLDPWGNLYVPDSRNSDTGTYVHKFSLGTNAPPSIAPTDTFGNALVHFGSYAWGSGGAWGFGVDPSHFGVSLNSCPAVSGTNTDDCTVIVTDTGSSGTDYEELGITDTESPAVNTNFPVTNQSVPKCADTSAVVANNVTATTNTGSPVPITLNGGNTGESCSGGELNPPAHNLTFTFSSPSNGTLAQSPQTVLEYPGSSMPVVTYTPAANYAGTGSSYAGGDSFTYSVTDNSTFTNQTVTYDTGCTSLGTCTPQTITIPTVSATTSTAATVTIPGSVVYTTTTVSHSASPITYPGSITVTATISPNTGTSSPTGMVTFTVNGTAGSPVALVQSGSNGVASMTLTAVGAYTISASYTPSGSFVGSSGTDSVTINQATVTASVTAQDKTYDTTINATITGCTLTGVLGSDSVTCSPAAASFASANAGAGIAVTATAISLSGPAAANYVLSSTTAATTANINQATVTASVSAQNKTYDTTTNTTISCSLAGVLGSDSVTCSSGAASFASAGAGTGITVTATGISLSGPAAPNYLLSSTTATTTANITQATVTASVSAQNKTYDTTTNATITSCTLAGVLGTDSVSCSSAAASFTSAGAGTGITVTATGISLSGAAAANYALSSTTATTTANISQVTVTASVSAQNKTYDTTTNATITGCSLAGMLGSDSVTCSSAAASFASAGAGTGITVTATGISLSGTAAANYLLSSTTATTTANIGQATLIASVTAANKAYNGVTNAVITACTLAGVLGSDNVICSPAAANFASIYPGTGITVTANGISLSGTAAANYLLLSTTAMTTANISLATVIPSVTAANKNYDGLTTATITSCSLAGVVGSDNVTCTATGSNTFSSASPGTNVTVTARGITLSGLAASYYLLSSTTATTHANILAVVLPPKAIPYMTSILAGGNTTQYTVGATCPSGKTAIDVWGDGCLATEAVLGLSVEDQVVDQNGNIFLAARSTTLNGSAFVRKVDATTGVITVYAGGNASGTSCTSPDSNINGSGNAAGDGCPASNAYFKNIRGLAIDANYLYVSDESNSKIHRIGLSANPLPGRLYAHELELVVGDGTSGWNGDGPQATTQIKNPYGVAVDARGNVFWSDGGGAYALRMVDYSVNPPQVRTVVNYTTSTTTPPTAACETNPLAITPSSNATTNGVYGLTFDKNGNLYFGEKGCYSLRKVTPNPTTGIVDGTGTFSTLIGTGSAGSSTNTWYNTAGTLGAFRQKIQSVTTASLDPGTWTSNSSNLYISTDTTIWFYDAASGWVHQIMGLSLSCTGHTTAPYVGCPAPNANFSGSTGGSHMSVDTYGNLYVADYGNGLVTKLGIGTDFVGSGPSVLVSLSHPLTQTTLIHGSGVCTGGSATVLSTAAPFSIGVPATTCSSYGSGTDYQTDWVVSTTFTPTPTTGGPQAGTLSVGTTNIALDGYGNNPVTISCNSISKNYGDPDPSFTYTANPAVAWTVAPVCAVGTDNGVSGSPYAITVNNCASLAAAGFGPFTCNAGQLTVNPLPVTAVVTAAEKPYDTTTTATITSCTLTGVVNGDNLTCTAASASFATAAAGTGITVNATGITLGGSAAANYVLSSTSAIATATIDPVSVTASVTAASKTFDTNTAATITGCTLTGVLPADATNVTCAATAANFAAANAGPGVTVTATGISLGGSAVGNYTLSSTTATTTADISQATPMLTLSCTEVTYDGQPHACTATATGVGSAAVSGSFSFNPASATNAGSYTVTATFTSNDSNYVSGGTVAGTLKIDAATPMLAITCAEVTYDGQPHACTATATGVGSAVVSGSFSFNPASATNAGSHTVTGTFTSSDSNYVSGGTAFATLKIDAATPVLTVTCTEVTYDGQPHACTATATGVGSVMVSGSFSFNPASEVNAGSYTVTGTFTSSDSNYVSGGTASGILKIDAATPVLTVTCTEVTYDGQPHACTATATGVGSVAVSGSFSFNPASEVNAGSYTVTGTFTSSDSNYVSGGTAAGTLKIDAATPTVTVTCPTGITFDNTVHSCSATAAGVGSADISSLGSFTWSPAQGETNAGSYVITATFSGSTNYTSASGLAPLAIAQAVPIIVVQGLNSFMYDGTTHQLTCQAQAPGGGVQVSGTCTVTPSSITNAGSYTITASFISADPNFTNAGPLTGTLVVSPATPILTVTCNEVTYDGNSHTCTGSATGPGGVTVIGSFGFNPGSESQAGTYPETGTFTTTDPNYVSGGTANGSLIIDKAPPTIKLTCTEVTYDNHAHACTGSVTGVSGGPVNGSLVFSPASEVNAASYPVTGTFTSSDTNYSNGKAYSTLIIDPATPVLTVLCAGVTYDGQTHTCTGTATGVGGVGVSGSFLYNPASETSAGSYPVAGTFTSSDSNYGSGGTANSTLNIHQAPATVTPNAASKAYGTLDPPLTGTLTGFVASDNVTAIYSRTPGETVAGSPYAISATLSPASVLGNYNIVYNTAGFTIFAPVPTITCPDVTWSADKAAQPGFSPCYSNSPGQITYSNVPAIGPVKLPTGALGGKSSTLVLNTTTVLPYQAGVTVSIAATANYQALSQAKTFYVNPANSSISCTYTSTNGSSGQGLPSNATYGDTITLTCTPQPSGFTPVPGMTFAGAATPAGGGTATSIPTTWWAAVVPVPTAPVQAKKLELKSTGSVVVTVTFPAGKYYTAGSLTLATSPTSTTMTVNPKPIHVGIANAVPFTTNALTWVYGKTTNPTINKVAVQESAWAAYPTDILPTGTTTKLLYTVNGSEITTGLPVTTAVGDYTISPDVTGAAFSALASHYDLIPVPAALTQEPNYTSIPATIGPLVPSLTISGAYESSDPNPAHAKQKTGTVTVHNKSGETLGISAALATGSVFQIVSYQTFTGTTPTGAVSTTGCAAVVGNGTQTCVITVSFSPTNTTAQTDTLTINVQNNTGDSFGIPASGYIPVVTLHGTGIL